MFEPKQSDYWFIENTNDFIVSTISSVSAAGLDPCKGDLVAMYPMVYKINRDTNKKKTLFPSGSAQLTNLSAAGYIYSTVPNLSVDIDLDEISKPQIAYNKKNGLYNISFTGKYSDNQLGIFTYIFQDLQESWHLVDSHGFIPESKNFTLKYTFENGYINPDYIIKGNTTRSKTDPKGNYENINFNQRSPDYQFRPFHYNNEILFSSTLFNTNSATVSGDRAEPITFAGGFITQRRIAEPISTENCIRIDFTCKCYQKVVSSNTLGLKTSVEATNTTPPSGYRSVIQHTANSPGEGFCVFLYDANTEIFPVGINVGDTGIGTSNVVGIGTTTFLENSDVRELDLEGVGTTMGYVPASAAQVEANGLDFNMRGIQANGFLAVCFDIVGNFCTEEEGMPGNFDGSTTLTQLASSIGVRGGKDNGYKVLGRSDQLTSFELNDYDNSASSLVPQYKDFRVEVIRNGTYLKVFGRQGTGGNLPTGDFTLLYQLDLKDFYTKVPKFVKAGLTFNTTEKVNFFTLNKFKVTGVASNASTIPLPITFTTTSDVNQEYSTSTTGNTNTDICIYTGSTESSSSQISNNLNPEPTPSPTPDTGYSGGNCQC